jgi:spore coat polysaccharide biosynthesis protein SpsF
MGALTAVIVQARMGSSRLPGKVCADLAGRPVLQHVFERCAAIPTVDVVCCATSERREDDVVARLAEAEGAVVVRGPEHDVLGRYLLAARILDASVILRVTADCPLLDPKVCGDVLAARATAGADFASNNMPPSWPHGLDCEAFTRAALERAAGATRDAEDREHVSPYMRRHCTSVNLACPVPGVAAVRWTLDTPADLEFLRLIVPLLPGGPTGWDYRVPLRLMQEEPALRERNARLLEESC